MTQRSGYITTKLPQQGFGTALECTCPVGIARIKEEAPIVKARWSSGDIKGLLDFGVGRLVISPQELIAPRPCAEAKRNTLILPPTDSGGGDGGARGDLNIGVPCKCL